MPADMKRLPRLDAAEVAAIALLADVVSGDGLPGASAASARLALVAACRRIARTDARREALVVAVAARDPLCAKGRTAVLQEVLAEKAAPARRRFLIPHPKVAPTPRARGVGGRYIKTEPSGR